MAGYRPIKSPVRKESEDERKVSAEWRKLGYSEVKIEKCNHNGWPDRFYASAALKVRFWCEWKREDTDVIPGSDQDKRHQELRANGETVIVAHSREDFWRKVRALQQGAK
jgi:hypothetical protein